jgi:hypothetical protein
MLALAVPASLFGLAVLLFLAGRLDLIGVRTTVKLATRPSVSPEEAEAIIAAELAPYLDQRPDRPDGGEED